jgi:hypothetical protein
MAGIDVDVNDYRVLQVSAVAKIVRGALKVSSFNGVK